MIEARNLEDGAQYCLAGLPDPYSGYRRETRDRGLVLLRPVAHSLTHHAWIVAARPHPGRRNPDHWLQDLFRAVYSGGIVQPAPQRLYRSGHRHPPGLGGTKICFDALLAGEVDLYPEYTGTGLQVLLNTPDSVAQEIITDADAVYGYVKGQFKGQYGIDWLQPLGFNNTYALMIREEMGRRLRLERVSDLAR